MPRTTPAPAAPTTLLPYSAATDLHTRIYISGPMTGYPGLNLPAFAAAADTLRALGHDPVNPGGNTLGPDPKWADYLRVDLVDLVTCSAVALLPGWHASKGARLEIHVAKELGLTVHTIERWIRLGARTAA